ncbi:MAG: hypothetical protein WCF84_11835 [Anaerolineae bacterium]
MSILQIPDDLAQIIQQQARLRGVPIEDFLSSAVLREQTLADRLKIEQEQEWWLGLPLKERAQYQGEFIAVHEQQLVDHDKDNRALHERIRAKYGRTAILIMPAEGPREIRIFSPRIIR